MTLSPGGVLYYTARQIGLTAGTAERVVVSGKNIVTGGVKRVGGLGGKRPASTDHASGQYGLGANETKKGRGGLIVLNTDELRQMLSRGDL